MDEEAKMIPPRPVPPNVPNTECSNLEMRVLGEAGYDYLHWMDALVDWHTAHGSRKEFSEESREFLLNLTPTQVEYLLAGCAYVQFQVTNRVDTLAMLCSTLRSK